MTLSSSNAGRSGAATAAAAGDRDLELLDQLASARVALNTQIARRIVGQREVVDNLVAALLAGGHALLVGVPGLAKTLLVQTVAQALDLQFSRVQFTPDLMPSDITGTEIMEEDHSTGRRLFKFVQGPVFGNVVLADEINRAPPKTQAALLQAMQEHAVTAAGKTHRLPEPFFVLATQNPIEQEGTYPLPEAQLDRFMVQLNVGYPSREEEERIVAETTTDSLLEVRPVLNGEQLSELLHLVRRLPAAPSIVSHAVQLARATRPDSPDAGAMVKKYVSWGAGPRASQYLILGAKARAAMDGRAMPDLEDVAAMALPVLGHRVVLNFQAEAEGVDSASVVRGL
ncbi:MAG: ATPase associated with various cellular 3, partial [Gemmatimonadetes bacterium]|nr:ATPase associated with various cellular 3 [Gemmatimonadota bacterium]